MQLFAIALTVTKQFVVTCGKEWSAVMERSKHIVNFIMVMLVILTMMFAISLSVDVYATSSENTPVTGYCGGEGDGTNVTWSYQDHVLTISGTGKMVSFSDVTGDMLIPLSIMSSDEIEELVIEEGVTEIGDYCFFKFTRLFKASLPDSLTSIGSFAFNRCGDLKRITIPDNVKSIGSNAFADCNQLSEVNGMKNVETLGDSVFLGTAISTMVLPGTLTVIPDNLFFGCINIKELKLENGITKIGSGAFGYCEFSELVIPDSVTEIGSKAFTDCGRMKTLSLSNSLKTISSEAFHNTAITNITIPSSVNTIEADAFSGCFDLKNVIIPESVTTIGRHAFDSDRIVLPKSLANIANFAFSEYTQLVYCKTKAQVDYCEDMGYNYIDCTAPIDIANSVLSIEATSYDYTGEPISPAVTATYDLGGTELSLIEDFDYTVSYEDNVNAGTAKVIITGINGFSGTKTISFDIKGSGSSQGNKEEQNTTTEPSTDQTTEEKNEPDESKSTTLPQTEHSTDVASEITETNTETNNPNSTATSDIAQSDTSASEKPSVDTSVSEIQKADTTSSDAKKQDTKTASKKTTEPKQYLIKSCYYRITGKKTVSFIRPKNKNIAKLTIPKTVKIGGKTYKVTSVGEGACESLKKLRTVTVGDNVTTVGNRAFMNCKKLDSITFGKNIISLGEKVLYNSKKLRRVKFVGNAVKKIGAHTFKGVPRTVDILVPNKKVKKYLTLINNASK